ncbi:M56 family metallopeptidase [Soonwooa sp.]|uniref:M56 family metallopeptidase n=1 Tax=Soonwooa sp. TaxID=1938592 RepID=UPI002896C86A|nr:M56 family metallopeptidase [Soonwooa sp.]
MIPFYLKYVAVSSLLIIFYYLVLENQKNHHFKRFFLLASLAFSLGIPFMEIPFGSYYVKASTFNLGQEAIQSQIIEEAPKFDISQFFFYLYLMIVGILILKLMFQIGQILFKKVKAKNIVFKTYKISLLEENIIAFSFLNTIYINRQRFENNNIDNSILVHEQTHITQKHSYDILLIEFLKALFWLNPALYFFKNAITTNHEFLADDAVLKQKSLKDYQEIIYQEVSNHFFPLTQTFKRNNNTKKRFIMMNTKKSNKMGFRIFGSVLFTCGVAFLFAEKVKTPIAINDSVLEKNTQQKVGGLAQSNTTEFQPSKPAIANKVSDTIKRKNELEAPKIIDNASKSESEKVEKPAEYPGGIGNLRRDLAIEINTISFENIKGFLKTESMIKIDSEGKFVTVTTTGENQNFNKEVERTLNKILQNVTWEPAKKDGKSITSYYKLPVVMQFAEDGKTPPPPPPPSQPRKSK